MNNDLLDKNPYWGVLGIDDRETDYQLVAGELKLPKPRMTFWDKQLQYHQPEVSGVSCTIHGAMGAVSDLVGVQFDLVLRKSLWQEALVRGADPAVGWYIARAVDLIRQRAKESGAPELVSFRVDLGSKEFEQVIDLGYSVVAGFRGNSAYGEDKADGVLDGTSFPNTTYGHCIRIVASKNPDSYDIVVDNYFTTRKEKNRYSIPRANFAALLKNGIFFSLGYIFAVKEDWEKHNSGETNSVPVWAVASVAKAQKKMPGIDWSESRESMDREGLEAVFKSLKLASSVEGKLPPARVAVILDRAKLLD
jgi:hypothetical protein